MEREAAKQGSSKQQQQAAAHACDLPTVLAVPAPFQSAPRRRLKKQGTQPESHHRPGP